MKGRPTPHIGQSGTGQGVHPLPSAEKPGPPLADYTDLFRVEQDFDRSGVLKNVEEDLDIRLQTCS